MNDMRKLMEAVEQLTEDQASLNPREYEAFVYGVEWGNDAQYSDGGFEPKDLPGAYNDWVVSGRKGYYAESVQEETTDIQYPDYDEYEGSLDTHVEEINQILRTDPDSWHAAIKVIKQIMNNSNIVAADLE